MDGPDLGTPSWTQALTRMKSACGTVFVIPNAFLEISRWLNALQGLRRGERRASNLVRMGETNLVRMGETHASNIVRMSETA
jgi:hypothetical protein